MDRNSDRELSSLQFPLFWDPSLLLPLFRFFLGDEEGSSSSHLLYLLARYFGRDIPKNFSCPPCDFFHSLPIVLNFHRQFSLDCPAAAWKWPRDDEAGYAESVEDDGIASLTKEERDLVMDAIESTFAQHLRWK